MQSYRQHGFVLVATLWVLVIVAMAAAYFSERVARSVELAQQSQQNTQALIDMAGTRAEILYRLGTTSLTAYGIGRGQTAIPLDDRPFKGLGNSLVRLQDTRGLFNLNYPDEERLQRLLGVMGIPATQRSRMIDTLRDYIDMDDLHRLNGAEKEAYSALGLPPPANNYLVSPWEAQRIMAWSDTPQLWQDDRLLKLTTTSLSAGLNPNTAPVEVLVTLTGVTEDMARAIVARRNLSPIIQFGQLTDLAPITTEQLEEGVILHPGNSIRVTQYAPGIAWALQYSITLTPLAEDAPWKMDYFGRIRNTYETEPVDPAPRLPERSEAPPEEYPE
jgi:DNA uptake protein ComE-like DNA-binding protein/type II secretory pathway pseudopilin PulG